jgi:hypothetical protein
MAMPRLCQFGLARFVVHCTVYDISKKLGLENREIIAAAKELGIAAAKVPSSGLDRITGEWLEKHLLVKFPEIAARLKHPPQQAKEQSQNNNLPIANDEQSLAIRLKGDASIEIYNFNDAGFQQ